jgi:hypothetical protein
MIATRVAIIATDRKMRRETPAASYSQFDATVSKFDRWGRSGFRLSEVRCSERNAVVVGGPRFFSRGDGGGHVTANRLNSSHFDDRVTLENCVAPLGCPGELRPAKAIAKIPIARIEPSTAFVLSHPLNFSCSSGDIL